MSCVVVTTRPHHSDRSVPYIYRVPFLQFVWGLMIVSVFFLFVYILLCTILVSNFLTSYYLVPSSHDSFDLFSDSLFSIKMGRDMSNTTYF